MSKEPITISHPATKETVEKAHKGGNMYQWRRLLDEQLTHICLEMIQPLPLCPSPKKGTPTVPLSGGSSPPIIGRGILGHQL